MVCCVLRIWCRPLYRRRHMCKRCCSDLPPLTFTHHVSCSWSGTEVYTQNWNASMQSPLPRTYSSNYDKRHKNHASKAQVSDAKVRKIIMRIKTIVNKSKHNNSYKFLNGIKYVSKVKYCFHISSDIINNL